MSNNDFLSDPYPQPSHYSLSGAYRGRVEDDKDPEHIGRVRVRIPTMHGIDTSSAGTASESDEYVTTDSLPWCPVVCVGAGYDQGSYVIPEVGTTVFVIFEAGDIDKPIVIGGSYGAGKSASSLMGSMTRPDEDDESTFSDTMVRSNGAYYEVPNSNEVPSDAENSSKNKIIYKSPKGATISIIE